MNFGIFSMLNIREGCTQAQAFEECLDLVQESEAFGIDTFWLGESHFRPERAVVSSPLTVASAVPAQTNKIRVGIAVQVLPLANPIRIAEEAAIVDHISKGRLDFGVGRSSFLDAYQGHAFHDKGDLPYSLGLWSGTIGIISTSENYGYVYKLKIIAASKVHSDAV